MKKVLFAVLCAVMCQSMVAQETRPELVSHNESDDLKNEVSISTGVFPMTSYAKLFADIFTTPLTGEKEIKDYNFMCVNASYGRHLSDKFVVGASVSYSRMDTKYKQMNPVLTQNYDILTVMPYAKINWVNKDHFVFYSRVAAGAGFTFAHETEEGKATKNSVQTNFLCQVSPVGFEWGGEQFRGFAELGFGQEGCVQVGFRYRF